MTQPHPANGIARARRLRVPALALAALVLLLDQGSKAVAVDRLASPVHPLLVEADGQASAAALLARRGLTATEAETALRNRYVWRYARAEGLTSATSLAGTDAPRQLIATGGTGFPAPRRLRIDAGDARRSLGEVVAERWRVPAGEVDALLAERVFEARAVVGSAEEVPAAGELIAVLSREIPVIPGFMTLVYAENPGAAWGFLRGASAGFRVAFFTLIGLLASLAMGWAIWTGWMGSPLGSLALAGVLGGALGNLIDRNLHTVVIDFVLNYVGDARWPVYNVADIGISVGVALILLELLLSRAPATESPVDGASV